MALVVSWGIGEGAGEVERAEGRWEVKKLRVTRSSCAGVVS